MICIAIHPALAVFVTPARRAGVVPPYGVIITASVFFVGALHEAPACGLAMMIKGIVGLARGRMLSVGAGLCSALFSSIARPRAEQSPAPTHSLPLPFAVQPAPAVFVTWARRAAEASAPTVSALPFVLHHGLGGIRHPRLRAIRESPLRQKHRRRFFVGALQVAPALPHLIQVGLVDGGSHALHFTPRSRPRAKQKGHPVG